MTWIKEKRKSLKFICIVCGMKFPSHLILKFHSEREHQKPLFTDESNVTAS